MNDMATWHVCQSNSCKSCKIIGRRYYSIDTYLLSSNYNNTTNYYTIKNKEFFSKKNSRDN